MSTGVHHRDEDRDLRVVVQPQAGLVVVALTGEMDFATAPALPPVIRELLSEGRDRVLVDLRDVTFVDGSAIQALIDATGDVAAVGGCLHVTPHRMVTRILEITGETRLLNMAAETEGSRPAGWRDEDDSAQDEPGFRVREAQLLEAVASHTVVGQATGMLMERFGLGPERAMDVLKRISSHSNTKLRLVADHLVETGQLLDTAHRDHH